MWLQLVYAAACLVLVLSSVAAVALIAAVVTALVDAQLRD